MKIQKLTTGLFAALVLSSPIVGAEEYPAANFEPKVLYNDSSYEHSDSSSTSTNKKAETSKPDPKYPAANFQPEVVYQDSNYKHQQTTSSKKVAVATPSTKTSSVEKSSTSSSSANNVAVAKESDDSMTSLLGLIALAVGGFVFFQKKSACSKKRASAQTHSVAPRARSESGSTGVARYLSKNQPELSTVAKYLENKEKTPVSGVSKYVARKVVAAKAAAAAKTTGVEKYLRDRG